MTLDEQDAFGQPIPDGRQISGEDPGEDRLSIRDAFQPENAGGDDVDSPAADVGGLDAPTTDATGMDEWASSDHSAFARQAEAGDDESNGGTIVDEPTGADEVAPSSLAPDQALQQSAHRVAVELKHIESEVRRLLEERDTKRKRKLSGTQRWLELEEDIVSWRFAGRFDEPTLLRLRQLIARRHTLFHELRFLAFTRPTWNT